jgi:hypothetical protein
VYPEFRRDPHPALVPCVRLDLRARRVEWYDSAGSTNPPVLHRREALLAGDDTRWAKYARLTAAEERAGLLEEPAGIGTREAWRRRVAERGYALKRHRLVRG